MSGCGHLIHFWCCLQDAKKQARAAAKKGLLDAHKDDLSAQDELKLVGKALTDAAESVNRVLGKISATTVNSARAADSLPAAMHAAAALNLGSIGLANLAATEPKSKDDEDAKDDK